MIETLDVLRFLNESNKIEGVFSADALEDSYKAYAETLRLQRLKYIDLALVHTILLRRLEPELAGNIRGPIFPHNVRVGDRICPKYQEVPKLLAEWIKKYGKGVKTDVRAKKAHVEFEKIHPFCDGNGRVGRLIWLWHREKAGLPFKIIKFDERQEYYGWFK